MEITNIMTLVPAAIACGMPVPDDVVSSYDRSKYNHWALFVDTHLHRGDMIPKDAEWHNAVVIKNLAIGILEYVTWAKLDEAGFKRNKSW